MTLSDRLSELVARHPVPGAAVGVWHDGAVDLAFTGSTSVENPLPVDENTLFQIGSVSKTFAATAVMRLVEEGRVSLDDPVRAHVPELRLRDETTARDVRVRHLLNHTAGWDGSMSSGSSDPELPLASFVDTMAELEQATPLGARAAYNNAAIALAGRLVEKVTEQPYESAVRSLLLTPLALDSTHFTTDDLATERCMVGHMSDENGHYSVARPWRWPRSANPEGGLVSSVADQLSWAAFHMGDGAGQNGSRLLAPENLHTMRVPTVELVGNSLGEAVGLGWFLRTIDGTLTAGHTGTTNGQYAELCLVPERRFGVWVGNNGMPAGMRLNREAVDGILTDYLGLGGGGPEDRPYDIATDGEVAGRFEGRVSLLDITRVDGDVWMQFALTPAAAAEMGEVPEFEPCAVGFLPGSRGEFVLLDGPFEGMMGSFARASDGTVEELDLGGRWHRRLTT